MAIAISEKGTRVIRLIKAVKAVKKAIAPGDKLQLPGESPATYLGPHMDGNIQMHAFRLFDGTEVVLEAPALDRLAGQPATLVTAAMIEPAVR